MANQSLDSTSYGIFILICTFDYILAHYACVIGRVCDCIVFKHECLSPHCVH